MTTPNELKIELLAKKQQRPDPRSLDWRIEDAITAAQPAVVPVPSAEPAIALVPQQPPAEAKPATRLSLAQLRSLRQDQQQFGTDYIRKRYAPAFVAEFLASSYNLSAGTPVAAPQSLDEVAATHTHRSCDCEICGLLLNAGYRPITDSTGREVTWKLVAEAKKVEVPVEVPMPPLPECEHESCDHYACLDARRALRAAGFDYWDGRWQRMRQP